MIDECLMKIRNDWRATGIAEEHYEYLSHLGDDLDAKIAEMGAAALLEHMETNWSNNLRVSDAEPLDAGADAQKQLEEIFLRVLGETS